MRNREPWFPSQFILSPEGPYEDEFGVRHSPAHGRDRCLARRDGREGPRPGHHHRQGHRRGGQAAWRRPGGAPGDRLLRGEHGGERHLYHRRRGGTGEGAIRDPGRPVPRQGAGNQAHHAESGQPGGQLYAQGRPAPAGRAGRDRRERGDLDQKAPLRDRQGLGRPDPGCARHDRTWRAGRQGGGRAGRVALGGPRFRVGGPALRGHQHLGEPEPAHHHRRHDQPGHPRRHRLRGYRADRGDQGRRGELALRLRRRQRRHPDLHQAGEEPGRRQAPGDRAQRGGRVLREPAHPGVAEQSVPDPYRRQRGDLVRRWERRRHRSVDDGPDPPARENGAVRNPVPPAPIPKPDRIADNPYPSYHDFQAEALHPGVFYTNYASIGQRRGSTNFNGSFENTRTDGVIFGLKGFTRQNFRLNVDQQLTPRVDLEISSFYGRSDNHPLSDPGSPTSGTHQAGQLGPFFAITFLPPYFDLFGTNPDGTPFTAKMPPGWTNVSNPLYSLANVQRDQVRSRFTGGGKVRWRMLDWLTGEANYNFDQEGDDYN